MNHGSCIVNANREKSMPKRFSWVIEDKLAGMERPGSLCDLREDMEFLKSMNIAVIINLEEYYFNYSDFNVKHIPIEDFRAPKLEDFIEFVRYVDSTIHSGNRIVVHCYAGMGRTNLMIASYLMHHTDLLPDRALSLVRERRPVYFVNKEQIVALNDYYESFLSSQG